MPVHNALTANPDWLNTSRPLTADDLAGRLILVDFWTYCCINCIHVIPKLQKLEEEFGEDLTVIGVHSAKFDNEGDQENIRKAIIRYGIHHPVVNDNDFAIWKNFNVHAWPTLLLISPQGKIIHQFSGEGDLKEMRLVIAQLIEKFNQDINKQPLPIDFEKDKEPDTILKFPSKITFAENFYRNKPALILTDSGHNRIVIADPENGEIHLTIGGDGKGLKDGSFETAQFNAPQGTAFKNGKLYIADTGNHALRIADIDTQTVTTLAGNGNRGGILLNPLGHDGTSTELASPWDIAFYPDDKTLVIANAGTHQLLTYGIESKKVKPFAGNGREHIDDGVFPVNSLSQPSGLSAHKGKLYFVDSETSSLRVADGRTVKTLIGTGLFDFGLQDGKQGTALMQHPLGLTATDKGVYIADSYNHAVRFYDFTTKQLSTLTNNTELNEPNDVKFFGNGFLIADTNNHHIVTLNEKTQEIEIFDIIPKKSSIKWDKNPPNLEIITTVNLALQPRISFEFRDNWKINDDAPSYLGLFDADKRPVKIFNHEELKKAPVALPALEGGKQYYLQGTFYYCEDSPNSPCLIKSIETSFTAQKNGQETLPIDLK